MDFFKKQPISPPKFLPTFIFFPIASSHQGRTFLAPCLHRGCIILTLFSRQVCSVSSSGSRSTCEKQAGLLYTNPPNPEFVPALKKRSEEGAKKGQNSTFNNKSDTIKELTKFATEYKCNRFYMDNALKWCAVYTAAIRKSGRRLTGRHRSTCLQQVVRQWSDRRNWYSRRHPPASLSVITAIITRY